MSRAGVAKAVADLQQLKKLGLVRTQGRRNLMFDCPFHSSNKRQDTPSFGIHIETGEWNCFNPMCGMKGPSVQVLFSRLTGIPEEEANIMIPAGLGATDDLRRKLAGIKDEEATAPMAPYPVTTLIGDTPAAVAYMKRRVIPAEVWERLGLCFAAADRMRSDFVVGGPTVSGNRIIFPIELEDGKGFMGRSLVDSCDIPKWRPIANTGPIFYDPLGILTGIYSTSWVLLVEGEFDAAACVREGLPVLGCFGSKIGLEKAVQLQAFDRIVTLFDGDSAGIEGAKQFMDQFGAILTGRIKTTSLPTHMDPAKLPVGFGDAIRKMATVKTSFSDRLKGKLHG